LAAPAGFWIGTRTIRDGAAFAGELADRMRTPPSRDRRFHLGTDGNFDLRATGFSYGLSELELRRRLTSRRRQTALTAYLLAAMGAVLLVLWLVQVVHTELTAGRVVLGVEFLPAALMCVLGGFYQALINYQIRAGRAASWREFLTTDTGFWPSP
jgi:hypothetical protein